MTYLVLLLILSALPAASVERFTGTGGSDSHPCSATTNRDTRRATVNGGASCLQPGDTLTIVDGTYPESLRNVIPAGLGPSQHTVVRAEHRRQAILNGTPEGGTNAMIRLGTRDTEDRPYITIDGLVIQLPSDRTGTGIYVQGTATSLHDQTYIHNEIRGGIDNGTYDSNSTGISAGGNFGLGAGPGNSLIQDNYIHDIGANAPGPAYAYGIYFSGQNTIIDGNEIARTTGYGFHGYASGGSFNHNIFRNNFIHDTGGPILLACGGADNEIYNNIVARIGLGPAPQRGGMVFGTTCSGQPANNNYIYNNTMVDNHGDTAVGGCIGLSYAGLVSASNNVVRNNICWHNSPDDMIRNSSDGATTNTIDHNLQGPNPLFTNGSGSFTRPTDFQLARGSPAIDVGVSTASGMPTFTTDHGGNARQMGTQDLGAWEAGGVPVEPVEPVAPSKPGPAYWPFAEGQGTTVEDATHNGHTLALTGGVTWSPGKIGPYAITCDGVDARATTAVFNLPQYSFLFWMQAAGPPATTLQQPLMNGGGPNGGEQPWGFSWGHPDPAFRQAVAQHTAQGWVAAQIPGPPLEARTWYHIAGTYDGTTLRVYLNGQLRAEVPAQAPVVSSDLFTLCWTGGIAKFAGSLDEVKVFDTALAAPDIAREYGAQPRVPRRVLQQY